VGAVEHACTLPRGRGRFAGGAIETESARFALDENRSLRPLGGIRETIGRRILGETGPPRTRVVVDDRDLRELSPHDGGCLQAVARCGTTGANSARVCP